MNERITRRDAQATLTELDYQEAAIKQMSGKLGEATMPVSPADLRLMFASYAFSQHQKARMAVQQKMGSLRKAYGDMPEEVWLNMEKLLEIHEEGESKMKRILSRHVQAHGASTRLIQVKGFSAYRLGNIMGHIRFPERFATPSKLCVYAGIACKNGVAQSLYNWKELREIKEKEYVGDPDEFSPYGHSTKFAKEMWLAVKAFIKLRPDQSWFRAFYDRQKARLVEKAKNEDRAYLVTEENKRKGYDVGRWYMRNRKRYSLKLYAHNGALRRMMRVLLHLVYTEWMRERGYEPRIPYPIEYLGHSSLIKLEEILAYEAKYVPGNRVSEEEE